MHFRPYPVLTIIAIPALVALVWLGVWQAGRAGWKADLIRQFEANAHMEPLPAATLCDAGAEGKVIAPPPVSGPTLRVFGHEASGAAGWRLFQVTTVCDAATLVETGFEALQIASALPPKDTGPVSRFIVAPWPEKPFMAAENSPQRNEWHWFDAPLMAASIETAPLDARYIAVPLTDKPDFLTRTPPETHIGYSVTWFGMAVAFLVIYGVFHARAGRLRFGKGKAAE